MTYMVLFYFQLAGFRFSFDLNYGCPESNITEEIVVCEFYRGCCKHFLKNGSKLQRVCCPRPQTFGFCYCVFR